LQPTYAALVCGAQASPVVATDETGWRVGGRCRATNGWYRAVPCRTARSGTQARPAISPQRRELRKASPDGGDSYTPSAARQTPYPPGRAATGPDSPDPGADLKQEGCDSARMRTLVGSSFVVLAMGGALRD
jgi:hypothetical protein